MEHSTNISLKQTLETQLTLTPQLMQSIELLQYTNLELAEWVDQELLENPLLEKGNKDTEFLEEKNEDTSDFSNKFDDNWQEYFNDGRDLGYSRSYSNYNSEEKSFESFTPKKLTLSEHIQNQLNLVINSNKKFKIGLAIISSLNEQGFLQTDIDKICEFTESSPEEVEEIRQIITKLDPLGAGSLNLQEFLKMQLVNNGMKSSWAFEIVDKHFELLKNKKMDIISKELKITKEAVQKAMDNISELVPYPASTYESNEEQTSYIVPDVLIKKINGNWEVIINDEYVPYLKISPYYRRLIFDTNKTSVKKYLKDKLSSALWLIKSINQRQETMYKVTKCILELQKEFFEKGIMYLKPHTLKDVADRVKLHESTVSRATSKKYAQTPLGIFNLKFFFSTGIESNNSDSISSTVIKEKIKGMIAEENPTNPLSDTEIWKIMRKDGLRIGRRAIAKYRQDLNLLPRHLRKRIYKRKK